MSDPDLADDKSVNGEQLTAELGHDDEVDEVDGFVALTRKLDEEENDSPFVAAAVQIPINPSPSLLLTHAPSLGSHDSRKSSTMEETDSSMPEENEETEEAGEVYVMMEESFRVSRNTRVQWFLQYLNKTVVWDHETGNRPATDPLQIISCIPRRPAFPAAVAVTDVHSINPVSPGNTRFRITPQTAVTFLSRTYRLVFAVDLTPSMATVSLCNRCVVFDELYMALRDCLTAISQPSVIPGTGTPFSPKIFVTVIVHSPFLTMRSTPVIVKGFQLRPDSLEEILGIIRAELVQLEKEVVPALNADINRYTSLGENGGPKSKPYVTLEMTLANMLRKGLLSVQLLPENSSGHIIVVTDGIIEFPDVGVLDSLLSQLRTHTISVSFIRLAHNSSQHAIGSPFGYVCNSDLMEFIARTTTGSYLEYRQSQGGLQQVDIESFHKAFFTWTFQDGSAGTKLTREPDLFRSLSMDGQKRLMTDCLNRSAISVSVGGLLSIRLREGFTLKHIEIMKGETSINIQLTLPWKPEIELEYHIFGHWPPSEGTVVEAVVYLIAPYEFHFDLNRFENDSRAAQKITWGPYRLATLKRFKMMISSLDQTDNFLVHFERFRAKAAHYTLPETIRDHMPLFFLPPDDVDNPVISSEDLFEYVDFADFWRPLCTMDVALWQKWMHVHRISILLEHDKPLPLTIFTEKRTSAVRTSIAMNMLHDLLKEWTSIVLVDRHSYIRFIFEEGDTSGVPRSFFVVRMAVKSPCVVLRLAFLGGTAGTIRLKIVNDLNGLISKLHMPTKTDHAVNCCWRFNKPFEKMLIQYKDVPGDIFSTMPSSPATQERSTQTQSPVVNPGQFQALCRYLFTRRYLWMPMRGCFSSLKFEVLGNILTVLAKKRLKEGFQFASTSGGVFNLLLEIKMRDSRADLLENNAEFPSCVVQYVMFPPRDVRTSRNNSKSTPENSSRDPKFALAVEVWLEPQYGVAVLNSKYPHLEGLTYREINRHIHGIDQELLSAFLTFETLVFVCGPDSVKGKVWTPMQYCTNKNHSARSLSTQCSTSEDVGVLLPFPFNLPLLLAKCQKTLLKFSSFHKSQITVNFASSTDLLLSYFLAEMQQLHTKEILLSKKDCQAIMELLQNDVVMEPATKTAPTTPIHTGSFGWDCVDSAVESSGVKSFPGRLENEPNEASWRCFVWHMPDGSLIVTLVPSKFAALEEVTDALGIPEIKLTESQQDVKTYPQPTALVIPIYIFSTSFASLEAFVVDNIAPVKYSEHDFTHLYYVQSERAGKRTSECRSGDDWSAHRSLVRSASFQPRDRHSTKLWPLYSAFEDMYAKSFVQGLYRSLHLGFVMDPFDVQLAVDAFCVENAIEIDLTYFIRAICPEFAKSSRKRRSSGSRHNSGTNNPQLPDAVLRTSHQAIKLEFQNIIASCLKKVPTKADVFYFSPPGFCDSSSSAHSGRISHGSDGSVEFRHDDSTSLNDSYDQVMSGTESKKGFFEKDPDSFSGNSNGSMASVFGSSDFTHGGANMDDGLDDEDEFLSPLFMQFICTISTGRSSKILGSYAVQQLPTALEELNSFLDQPVKHVDWNDTTIRFDILCLSLPEELRNIQLSEGIRQIRTISGSSVGREFMRDSDSDIAELGRSPPNGRDEYSHLPPEQLDTVKIMVESLTWHLKDEIAYTLSISPIRPTEENLKLVVDHVGASKSRMTCISQHLPLRFVFNEAESFALFQQRFEQISIQNYRLEKEGRYYYLIATKSSPTPVRRRLISLTSRLSDDRSRTRSPSLDIEELLENKKESQKDARRLSLPVFTMQKERHGIVSAIDKEDIRVINRLPSIRDTSINDEDVCFSENGEVPENVEEVEEAPVVVESSTSEDDLTVEECANTIGIKLPGFWLIFKLSQNEASLSFHVHEHEIDAASMTRHKLLIDEVVRKIKAVAKLVNQEFLLRELNHTHKCENLLEPETHEELWKSGSMPEALAMESRHVVEDDEPASGSYLEASRYYQPGFFSCDLVYEHEFAVHPRLKMGPGRPSSSRGVQALLGLLNTFRVVNRHHMFVIQDGRGNSPKTLATVIFYIRLTERNRRLTGSQASMDDPQVGSPRLVVPLKDSDQQSGSLPENAANRTVTFEDAVFNNDSTSQNQTKKSDAIILSFYGICEVSDAITGDLITALQIRLDEAVLESLHASLFRNPMLKLSGEDVRFIQPAHFPPTDILRIDLPAEVRSVPNGNVTAFCYLLQNLGVFLYMPKYTDMDADRHFVYCDATGENWMAVDDESSFLFNRPPESGGKGIAFVYVIMNATNDNNAGSPMPTANIFTNLSQLTQTYSNPEEGDLQFLIWEKGDVDLNALKERLTATVRHALLDFWFEKSVLPSLKTPSDLPAVNAGIVPSYFKSCVEGKAGAYHFSTHNAPNRRCMDFLAENIVGAVASLGFALEYSARVCCVEDENIECELRILKLDSQKSAKDILLPMVKNTRPGNFIRLKLIGMSLENSDFVDKRPRSVSIDAGSDEKAKQKSPKRFLSRVDHTGKVIANRERLILLEVEDTVFSVYLYNFSPDNVASLNQSTTRLFEWQHERFRFMNNVLLQKCGIFLPIKCLDSQNGIELPSFKTTPMQVDYLALPSMPPKENMKHIENPKHRPAPGIPPFDSVMENRFPNRFFADRNCMSIEDPVTYHGKQFLEIRARKKRLNDVRSQLNKLYESWLQRDRRPVNEDVLTVLKSNSRPAHFCASPLLFDPSWRKNLGARFPDRHLISSSSIPRMTEEEIGHGSFGTLLIPWTSERTTFQRSRHGSGVPTPQKDRNKSSTPLPDNNRKSGAVSSAPSVPDTQAYSQIRNVLMQQYVHYLQMQGCSVVLTRPSTPQKSVRKSPQTMTRSTSGASSPTPFSATSSQPPPVPRFTTACTFLQRCVPGGMVFMELYFLEPFYFLRMYAADRHKFSDDYSSVGNDPDKALLNLQREIDRLKVAVHMHSFLYDFHLRRVGKYISGEHNFLKAGYHLVSFLEDFANYYQKAPSYSKSSYQSGLLTIPCGSVPAHQIYKYILNRDKLYGLCSLPMSTVENDPEILPALACVDLKLSPEEATTFNCRFIIWFDQHDIPTAAPLNNAAYELPLRYYIILTSVDEFFSTESIEERFGSFKTLPPPNRPRPATISEMETKPITENKLVTSEEIPPSENPDLTAKASLVAAFPNFLYIGYFSSLETELNRIVDAKKGVLEDFVRTTVRQANSDYVRDTLWLKLTAVEEETGKRRNREESGPFGMRNASDSFKAAPKLTAAEFGDLVTHVYPTSLNNWDARLSVFFQSNKDWLEGLMETLKIKYLDMHRFFVTQSAGPKSHAIYHLVLVSPQLTNVSLYMTLRPHDAVAEAFVLSRNPVDVPTLRADAVLSKFIEGFVNACCFHCWKRILPG